MAISEKALLKSIQDLSAIKEYMEFVSKKFKKYDYILKSGFEAMEAKEQAVSDSAHKVLKVYGEAAKEIDLIKKQFMPKCMELCQKLADENEAFKKRIDSLEHQMKKLMRA